MKKPTQLILAIILFIINGLKTSLAEVLTEDRKKLAQKAEQELLRLNFFYEGRGMVSPPNFPPFNIEGPLTKTALQALKSKLQKDFGIIIEQKKVIGFSQQEFNGVRVGVIGCAMCHTGRAAGITIPGLGNKNIDVFAIGNTFTKQLKTIQKVDQTFGKGDKDTRKKLLENFKYFSANLTHSDLHNLTQGLISTGIIRKWFYDVQGVPLDGYYRGQVKVPAFWGYGEKRKKGAFTDGYGNGVLGGWAIAVELSAGQKWQNILKMYDKIEAAEHGLGQLLPPSYPFEIDYKKANKGYELYFQNCASCHGTYRRDVQGHPIFEAPKLIPIQIVGTDRGRLQGQTDLYNHLVDINPLNEILQRSGLGGRGYYAPRLEGIWARFPYLHNASVPTVMHLMLTPEERPKYFSLYEAGEKRRFDKINLGLRRDYIHREKALKNEATKGARWVYDTTREGHSNIGHYFEHFSELTQQDRLAIIEYLKTL